jgi:hypothetical protein
MAAPVAAFRRYEEDDSLIAPNRSIFLPMSKTRLFAVLLASSVLALVTFVAGGGVEAMSPAKVTICHVPPGNPDNAQTIEVASAAVGSHLAHGDYEGACDVCAGQADGQFFCAAPGFVKCDHGKGVQFACAPGTTCVPTGPGQIICDFAVATPIPAAR